MKKSAIPITIILIIYAIILIATLTDYGATWDEPNCLRIGNANYEYIFKGIKIPLSLLDDIANYQPPANDIIYYGPAFYNLFYLSHHFLYEKLSWLSYWDSYHLGIIICAIAIAILFSWLASMTFPNTATAFWATILLISNPRYFSHCHNNPSDLPSLLVHLGLIISFYKFLATNKKKWLFITGAVFGIALATTVNSIFIIPLFTIWGIIYFKNRITGKEFINRFFYSILGSFIISVLIAFSLWPWWWDNTAQKIYDFFMVYPHYLKFSMNIQYLFFLGKTYTASSVPWFYPLVMLLITTPLTTILLFLLGSILLLKKIFRDNKYILIYPFLWIIIYLSKQFCFPNYNGIRHFLDILLPLCLIAGFGISWGLQHIKYKRLLLTIIIFFLLLSPGIALVKLHPYQITYYSCLVGGPQEAAKYFETIYWLAPFKEACQWLNKHAPFNSSVIVITDPPNLCQYYLREDIKIISSPQGEQNCYIIIRYPKNAHKALRAFNNKRLLFQINRGNQNLLEIYTI